MCLNSFTFQINYSLLPYKLFLKSCTYHNIARGTCIEAVRQVIRVMVPCAGTGVIFLIPYVQVMTMESDVPGEEAMTCTHTHTLALTATTTQTLGRSPKTLGRHEPSQGGRKKEGHKLGGRECTNAGE